MKKFIIGFLTLPFFIIAEPFFSSSFFSPFPSLQVITVMPPFLSSLLMGITRTWVDSCELQKELGHIVACSVYTAETAGTDPNVFLTITYENLAAMGPNKERYKEFTKAWRKKISESDQETIAGGYGDMREIVDLVVLRKVNFK